MFLLPRIGSYLWDELTVAKQRVFCPARGKSSKHQPSFITHLRRLFVTTEFSELGLLPQLVQAVTELGYTSPTAIQLEVIPLMLTGLDVIGQAQTGTGKTAAFALPMLQQMSPGREQIQALVMTPTRELAIQVAQAIHDYGRHLGVHVLPIYGGQSYDRQIRRLKKGVDVVVGTPGRLLDLINQGLLNLSQIQTLVLDEADEMLSMGFIEDIETILQEIPAKRQTALFSATLPAEIRNLAGRYMTSPKYITIEREQITVPTISQRYYLVNEADKVAALTRLFEVETISSALIFARTRAGVADLANVLTVRGFPAEALHGDLNQEGRERVLNRFRNNQIKVLVATDVAARGLDIDDISHVFNFDLPQDAEIYVHRIGRTGRAGKSGLAISLIIPKEKWLLRQIETFTRQKLVQAQLPTVEEIQTQREEKLVEQMMVWLRRGRCRREQEIVADLVTAGHDPAEIAAAALKLARAEEKMRPIAPVGEVEAEKQPGRNSKNGRPLANQSHEKGMVRLSLSVGKRHGIRPNDIVGAIAYHADIPGNTIGAIHIQEQHTLFDIPEKFVSQVLGKTSPYRVRQFPVVVERAQ